MHAILFKMAFEAPEGDISLDISEKTLENIFKSFFDNAEEGRIVTLVEMNWAYDFRNKSGALTKEELEFVINSQIDAGRIEVISPTEFKVVDKTRPQRAYIASQEVVEQAAAEYSKQFREKYRELDNT